VPHDRRRAGLLVLCVAMFISAIDMTIVNVALPAISTDLGAGLGELQWVIDGFLVCLAGLLLVGSGLADRFGRRRVFLLGVTGFAVTSVLAAIAETPVQLIGARILMGAAAACVLPPALSLIAVMFPPEERPRALGVWAAVAGAGLSLGPVLGGVLVPTVGWEAVFLVNVPGALVAVPAGLAFLPESRRPDAARVDLPGAALSVAGLAGIVFALIEGPDAGFASAQVLAAAGIGAAALLLFVLRERRTPHPLFDVRVLVKPAVAAGSVTILATYVLFLGTMFLLPQYLQYVHDQPVLASGLLLAPLGLGTIVAAPFNARVMRALGPRTTLAGGLVGMAASTALLLLLGRTTTVLVVVVSTALLGALIALCVPPATAVIMDAVGEEKAGDGGAANQMARQVGGALGVAVVGSIFAALYGAAIAARLPRLPAAARERAAD
jgi:EmrB/QacA subfamily drug resistance transporter